MTIQKNISTKRLSSPTLIVSFLYPLYPIDNQEEKSIENKKILTMEDVIRYKKAFLMITDIKCS